MANKTLKELSNVKFPRAVEKSEVEKILIHLSSRNSFRGMYLPQEVQGTYKNGKMTISATSIGGTIGRDGTTLYFDFKRQNPHIKPNNLVIRMMKAAMVNKYHDET